MRVVVIERYTINPLPIDWNTAHIHKLWKMHMDGVVREAYKFHDNTGAFYILEADDLVQAKEIMSKLPLHVNAFCSHEVFALSPYRSWECWFGSDDPKIKEIVKTPAKRKSTESLRRIWMKTGFSHTADMRQYHSLVDRQAAETFRYFKAGIIEMLYVVQKPFSVCGMMFAKTVTEAREYMNKLPLNRAGMWDTEFIELDTYDFWELLFMNS